MKKTTMKAFLLIVAILLLIPSFYVSYATEMLENGTILEVEVDRDAEIKKGNALFRETNGITDSGLPDFTIDDASNWAERKGFEVVGFLQKFIQPFAIVIFIGSGIIALVGAFGNSRLVSRGFVGMLIALVIYAVVLYAPEIMDAFLNWVSS